jgi:GNAT superfamily N-acetyltransferase
MIRLAQEADLPKLVAMGQRFRHDTTYNKYLRDNPARMLDLGRQLMSQDGLLLSERNGVPVGMLGFIKHNHFISGDLNFGEVFWWVEPEHRGEGVKLLVETENLARQASAKAIQMIAPNAKVAHFYEKMGYEFVESVHQKNL